MKIRLIPFLLLIAVMFATSCNSVIEFGAKSITPSDVTITEERSISNFTGIDMRTFGQMEIQQGESESLIIEGRDNLVPLVKTSVRDGVLVIEMEENINILQSDIEDLLMFHITLKDLTNLTISGLTDSKMETLSTSSLDVTMGGAGQFQLGYLSAEEVNIELGGVGSMEIAGEVIHATIDVSGAGEVKAADLKCQTADVTFPGLGSATIWVTDTLNGNISGGGSVSYYGNPETNLETPGLGSFKSLGDK